MPKTSRKDSGKNQAPCYGHDEGREKAQRSTSAELRQGDGAQFVVFTNENPGNQVAREHEEHVHAEVATVCDEPADMAGEDGHNCQRAYPVEPRDPRFVDIA